jgi:hypothetical protein
MHPVCINVCTVWLYSMSVFRFVVCWLSLSLQYIRVCLSSTSVLRVFLSVECMWVYLCQICLFVEYVFCRVCRFDNAVCEVCLPVNWTQSSKSVFSYICLASMPVCSVCLPIHFVCQHSVVFSQKIQSNYLVLFLNQFLSPSQIFVYCFRIC